MPRILRIINRLNLGGPTFNVAYLSKYLSPEFETLLVAGMIDDTEASSEFITQEMGLKPVYIPEMYREISLLRDRKAYIKLKKIISDFRPDIVHTHAAKAGALGRSAAASCNVPVIIHTFHGHVFHSYFPKWKTNLFIRIERYLARRSTRIVTVSSRLKNEIGEVYKVCPPAKIEVIPLGLDLGKFSEDLPSKRKKFRDHYQVTDNEVVIAIVGRLVPIKNHQLFLHALKQVLARTSKNIRAFIVGDGEERERMQQVASSLQIDFTDYQQNPRAATLTFTSWIREVDEVYAGTDIVALTSLNEGTPVSLIEAQAAGKPIVATNVGGTIDIVNPGNSAMLVASNDSTAFSHALLQFIEQDSLHHNTSVVELPNISDRFGYQRLIRDMSDLYYRLLREASG